PAFRRAYEIHHLLRLGSEFLRCNPLERQLQVLTLTEQRKKNLPKRADLRGLEADAPQPDRIDAAQRMGSIHNAKRWDVAAGAREAPRYCGTPRRGGATRTAQ